MIILNTNQAISKRIINICEKENITINKLANNSGVSPMTIYSIVNLKSKNPGIITIKILCDGWGINLSDFFNTDLFRNLDQDIY